MVKTPPGHLFRARALLGRSSEALAFTWGLPGASLVPPWCLLGASRICFLVAGALRFPRKNEVQLFKPPKGSPQAPQRHPKLPQRPPKGRPMALHNAYTNPTSVQLVKLASELN